MSVYAYGTRRRYSVKMGLYGPLTERRDVIVQLLYRLDLIMVI